MDKENLKKAQELRKKLHQCPELSGQEIQTKKTLIDFVKSNIDDTGEVDSAFQIVDKGKWFYLYYDEGAEKTIGFRADMDAVYAPDGAVKHACGHDGHSGTLMGLLLEVSDRIKKGEKLGKNICFIFQYGEETGEGGNICSKAIEEKKIDEIYAYHNIPGFEKNVVLLRTGIFACTSMGMILKFRGTPSHAAYPESGKNPTAAMGKLLNELPSIADSKKYKGMTLCTTIGVQAGSRAFGVAASEGEILLTIRGAYEADIEKLKQAIFEYAATVAKADEIQLEIQYQDVFPETGNHVSSVKKLHRICEKATYPYIEVKEPFRWSEDFGYYLKKCKGAMIGIGDGENHAQLHTADYEYPDDIMERAVDVFYSLIRESREN